MWLNILVSDQNRNIIFTNFAILTRVEKIPSQIIIPFTINDDHMYYIIGIVQGDNDDCGSDSNKDNKDKNSRQKIHLHTARPSGKVIEIFYQSCQQTCQRFSGSCFR